MQFKLLSDHGQRTYALVLGNGEDVMESVTKFARSMSIYACQFTAIGAFSEAVVGFFDFIKKDYKKTILKEQTEVLTLSGDISQYKNDLRAHAHVVLGKENGTAHGGRLLSAKVLHTLEIILIDSPYHIQRKLDEETGLPLIQL